jgi:hypothetical protein
MPSLGQNLAHTWSLTVEEHFYLLWPPVFILLKLNGVRGDTRPTMSDEQRPHPAGPEPLLAVADEQYCGRMRSRWFSPGLPRPASRRSCFGARSPAGACGIVMDALLPGQPAYSIYLW